MKTIQIQIADDAISNTSVYIYTDTEKYCIKLNSDKMILIRKVGEETRIIHE